MRPQDGVGHRLVRVVDALEHPGGALPARGGGRVAPRAEHSLEGAAGRPRPAEGDLAAPAMRHRGPCRATGRLVTPGHAQAQAVAEPTLAVGLPPPRTTASTAASIRQDHEWPGMRVRHTPAVRPPAGQRRDGTRRRIRRGADIHRPVLARCIGEPIGPRTPERVCCSPRSFCSSLEAARTGRAPPIRGTRQTHGSQFLVPALDWARGQPGEERDPLVPPGPNAVSRDRDRPPSRRCIRVGPQQVHLVVPREVRMSRLLLAMRTSAAMDGATRPGALPCVGRVCKRALRHRGAAP